MATLLCEVCQNAIDPTRDHYVTYHERKGPSINLCGLACAAVYERDDPA